MACRAGVPGLEQLGSLRPAGLRRDTILRHRRRQGYGGQEDSSWLASRSLTGIYQSRRFAKALPEPVLR